MGAIYLAANSPDNPWKIITANYQGNPAKILLQQQTPEPIGYNLILIGFPHDIDIVFKGTPEGNYPGGVSIEVSTLANDYRFVKWWAKGIFIADRTNPLVEFAMPNNTVELTAEFEMAPGTNDPPAEYNLSWEEAKERMIKYGLCLRRTGWTDQNKEHIPNLSSFIWFVNWNITMTDYQRAPGLKYFLSQTNYSHLEYCMRYDMRVSENIILPGYKPTEEDKAAHDWFTVRRFGL